MGARTILGWALIATSVIGWPLTQFTVARQEPPFTLGLSWFAVLLTGVDILLTAEIHDKKKK